MIMKLIGICRVQSLAGRTDKIDVWLSAWIAELSGASFGATRELLESFPKVEEVGAGSFVFPILDTGVGIRVLFAFKRRIAVIKEVIEPGQML